MSECRFEALKGTAAAVRLASLQPLELGKETSPRRAAENRIVYRAVFDGYLAELTKAVGDIVPADALEPLRILASDLASIDGFRAAPPLFKAGDMPFGLTKSIRRLHAEGNAVGCTAYLHETIGLRIMDACKAVASIFSWLGHAGRTAAGQIGDARKLSSKTLHQWYVELESKPVDADMNFTIRWAAKLAAMQALSDAERDSSTVKLAQDDARTKLAERIGNIAVGSLIGAPAGHSWRIERNSELSR